jgi:hypothetical protein
MDPLRQAQQHLRADDHDLTEDERRRQRDRVQQYLRDDELLLWYGVPDPNLWFTPVDVFLVPFGLLWCGFAIFWESMTLHSGAPAFFPLFGIPVLLIGLYLAGGRFFHQQHVRRRTVYAITTRRAMNIGPRTFTDMRLRDQDITIRRSADSRHASVTIGHAVRTEHGTIGRQLTFYQVADPDPMLQALDRARSQSTS